MWGKCKRDNALTEVATYKWFRKVRLYVKTKGVVSMVA